MQPSAAQISAHLRPRDLLKVPVSIPGLLEYPEEIRNEARWGYWKGRVVMNGSGEPKLAKIPGANRTINDARGWTPLDKAIPLASKLDISLGLSYLVTGVAGMRLSKMTALDLDDPKSEAAREFQAKVLDLCKGHRVEHSVGGKGKRVLFLGRSPGLADFKSADLDIQYFAGFPGAGHFTLTGRRVEGSPVEIKPMPEALAELLGKRAAKSRSKSVTQAGPVPPVGDFPEEMEADAVGTGGDTEVVRELLESGEWAGTERYPASDGRSEPFMALFARLAGKGYTAEEIFSFAMSTPGLVTYAESKWKDGPALLWREAVRASSFIEDDRAVEMPELRATSEKGATVPTLAAIPASEEDDFPARLVLEAPGVLGEIGRWYMRGATIPEPAYALLSMLGMMSYLLARQVRTDEGERSLHPNLLALGIGPTESGKETIGKAEAAVIAYLTGFEATLHALPRSAEGLWDAVAFANPQAFVMFEAEIGQKLYAMSDVAHGGTFPMLGEVLRTLNDKPGESVPAPALSTRDKRKAPRFALVRPYVSLIGTMTPSHLSRLAAEIGRDGTLNRFLVVTSSGKAPRRRSFGLPPPPESLKAWWEDFQTFYGVSVGNGGTPTDGTFAVPVPDDVAEFLHDASEKHLPTRRNLPATWGRLDKKAKTLALIASCAEWTPAAGPLVLTMTAAKWAQEVVETCARLATALAQATGALAENESDRLRMRLLAWFQSATAREVQGRDGFVSRTYMANACHAWRTAGADLSKKVLDALVLNGALVEVRTDKKASKGTRIAGWSLPDYRKE